MRVKRRKRSLKRELAKGAVAGAVATAVMDLATRFLYEHEPRSAQRREQRAGSAAVAPVTGRSAGRGLHWALGVGAGALYAALRPRFAGFDLGRGIGFGTGFWLLLDETVAPVLGLQAGSGSFPWQTHVRGLAGHLVFGTVTDSTLDLLDRVI